MSATVDEQELLQLNVGDFVAVLTHNMGDGKSHWTLGSVETPPYLRDVEIRLWEKQKDEDYNDGDLPNNEETEQLMNRIAEVKGELQKSIDEADALTEQLRARRASIMQQIGEADEYMAESRAVRDAARDDVESIPDRHWNELKSYRVPPKMVSLVIRAVMLLLSEDEARTWPQMQRILRDFNFKSRITTYDPEQQLSPERREYILQECVSKKSFRYDRAMQGSVAVGPIYYWVLAQLDCGEAQSNKSRVDKEKVARQKELRRVLKQLNEQQARIAEYQALMDDLDDQLRRCREQSLSRSSGGGGTGNSVSRSRLRSLAAARYENSFAGEQQKEYLRPAFYAWRPTDRVIIVLRKNVISNFGGTTKQEQQDGYNMSEPQVRMLDDELLRRQAAAEGEDEDARQRREAEEERQLEDDMFAQNAAEKEARERDDAEILEQRQRAAAEGKPTPAPSPKNDDDEAERTDRLRRTFEGKAWQKVLDRKRDAIVATFTAESAECLDVPEYYVSIHDLTVGSLIVDFDVTHDGKRDARTLQSSVDRFDYPRTKALYEEDDEIDEENEEDEEGEEAAPEHQMKFGGDRWGDIVPDHRQEVLDAFLTDTGNATSLPRNDIVVLDARVEGEEGLTVDYAIKNNELSAEEVQDLVDRFDYPCVWALYQQLAGLDEAGPLHQVRFRGERWETLLAENEDAIAAAFARDTANALEVPEKNVQTEDMRYERGLTVPYTVAGCALSEDDIDVRAEQYKYPETWALYDRLVAEACGAHYQRAFDGEHWETVLSARRPALTDAFRTDSATALEVPVASIEACSLDTDQDRLLVSFNVVDEAVAADKIRDETKTYEYPETWALYGQTVQEQQEGVANLDQTFDGVSWGAMLEEKEPALREAFQRDVSEQLQIPAEAVTVKDMTADDSSMTVHYGVQHDDMLENDVKKGLEDCAYPNTWDLYEELSDDELKARGFGGGSGESGILERRFDGDDWDILVDGCPDELRGAFVNDTSKCLKTSKSNVRVLSAEVGSLVVNYQIIDPEYDDDELARRVEEHDYEELMGLYRRRIRGGDGEEGEAGKKKSRGVDERDDDAAAAAPEGGAEGSIPADAPTVHAMEFEGDNWPEAMKQRGDDVKQAVREDAAEALGVPAEDIEDVDAEATPEGLKASVTVAPQDGQDADKMQEMWDKLDQREFPKTWSVYDEVPRAEIPSDAPTVHAMSFEADHWDTVMEQRGDDVKQAVREDAAAALGIPEEEVEDVDANPTATSLETNVTIAPQDEQDADKMQEMWDKLDQREFPKTWAIYEEVNGSGDIPADAPTVHAMSFEADNWNEVMEQAGGDVEEAIRRDAASALKVTVEEVEGVEAVPQAESLDTRITLAPQDGQSRDTMQDIWNALDADEFPETWAIYDKVTEENGNHKKRFEGDSWESVVEERRNDLVEAFCEDEAACLDAQPEQIDVRSVKADKEGVTIGYNLDKKREDGQEMTREDIAEKTESFDYPKTWSLYDESEYVTTTHQVGFDGDDWKYVVQDKPKELDEAFTTCTAELFDLRVQNVMNARYSLGSLIVDFDLQHPASLTEDEINQKLNDCPYEPVWDLYGGHPYDPKEVVNSTHELGFEGVGWQGVIDTNRAPLEQAFISDTARALDIEPEDVKVEDLAYEEESLIARLDVRHPLLQDDELIQEQLKSYPYDSVWALYQEDPNANFVTTAHQVGFDGEDWKYVVDNKKPALDAAFVTSVSELLDVQEENVTNVRYACENDALLVDFDCKHPITMTEEEANEKLGECGFGRVWDLYGEHPYDPNEVTTTSHEIGFEGDEWSKVQEDQHDALEEAIIADTAEALGVDRGAITDVKTSVADDVLVAKLKVTHHVLQDEELIQEQLSAYPYDRVWALYEDAPFSDEDEKGFGGAGQGESGELERVFEGDDWDILVDGCPDDVRGAFQRDTANALNITPDRVRVLSTEIGSLIVKYKIVDPPADDDELTNRVNDDEFPELMDMYRRRMRGGDGDEGATRSRALPGGEEADTAAAAPLAGAEEEDDGKYKKDFGGEHWHTFVDENRNAIADAFVEDTANALSIPPEDVTVKSVTADENGVRIGYEVPNGDAASDEEAAAHVAEKTDAYDYPAVWALYEELSEYMTSAHDMRFEAEGWEDVVRRRRWELARAIADDSAEAIGIEPDALVDTDMDVTETDLKLTAVFTHKREISMQEIHDKLDAAPFTRTWALYDSMRPSEVMPCHFDGESWAQILEERPDDVKKAFAADTAKAMNVSRLEVEVKDMTADDKGMTVDYVVRGSELDESAMQQRSEEYAYPETWGLYDGSVGSEKHFDGENWADVARDKREDLEDAFKQDTAEATGVPKDAVEVRQLRATEDGLDVDYLINADKAVNAPSRPEMEEKVNAYDYPNTWELYDLTEASKEAANQDRALGFGGDGDRESGELERVFEGDDWDILVDGGCRGDIDDAFQVGAARSLGVPKSNVVVLDAKIGSLHVNYKVRGCPDDDDEIARKIEEEEFPELMDLYKRRIRGGDEGEDGAGKKCGKPALPEGWEETGHQAGFDGEDWAYVAKTKEDEIQDAIKNDVAECLGTQPENVNDIDVNVDKQMLVDFTAQHPEELTSEDVDQRLKACKFQSVWDLYGDHPYDPNEKVTTNHSIGFEGEDWRYTVDKKHDAVLKAFKVGTGNALTVPESDVVDVTMDYDKDGIVLNCNVHHSPLQDEQMIQEQLQAYAYDEMWALYEVKPFDPEDNVETVHEIEFEGDAWKLVCELEGDEVRRAIVDDTAAALDVDTTDITDVEYDATDAAITARVKVQHSPLQDTEMISEMLASYEYPNVWALYDHSIESAPMTQTFAGAGWPAISEEKEEEIKDAFTADTAAMLNLDANHIAVQSVNATEEEGLAVEYTVFGNALSEDEIESRAESYAYPNVWNLYNENATEAVNDVDRAADAARGLGGGSGESGILERRFDGDDWDILVDGCPDELRGAFVNDTSKCLKTSKSNVRVLSAEVGSLVVNYQIIDPEYDDDELARRVEEHDYEELMGLYRRRIRGGDGEEGEAGKKKSRGVDERDDDAAAAAPEGGAEGSIPADAPTVHAMEFEGDNWPEAMKQRGDDVKQAVREDAAEALGVPAEDIEDVDAEATPEGLKASVTVAPQDGQDADKMQEMWDKLDQREFPKTWSVYDEVPRAEIPSDAPTVHAMSFEADHWDTVMEQRGDDVKQAVREDAAAALGIPEEEVEDVDANPTATSLETNVTIAPQDEQDADKMQEMWDKLDQREFPKTWAIYEEVNGSGDIPADAPTVHAMSFEGEEWPRVMEQQEEDVKEAIRNDAAAALGVSPDDIDVVEAETKPDALAANVTVAPQDGQSRETMQGMWDALNDHDFPQTWAIYDAAAAATSDDAAEPVSNARAVALEEDTVVDNHDHGFEGEDWDYVWSLKEDAVKEAFAKEVAAKLNIPPEHVADTTFEKSADGMVLTSQIRHPVSMSKEEVDAQLEDHGFPELWSLYEPRPYDPNDKIQTKHIVSFEGEAWDFVMEHREKELKEALRDDTAAALQIPPEDVLSTKPSVDANALEVSIAVAHSPLQDTEVIQEELATYGYDNVWALYCPPDEAPIATRYFEGEHWDAIVDAGAASGNADIREAFAEDTSRAMNNKPEDIEVRDVRTDKDGMTVEYAVQFCLDDPEDVEETSNNYPYPQVWALYKPVSPGEAEAASEPHRKNFPGDNWDPVLAENRQALDDAFKQDTAEALGVQKENVEVSSVYTTPEDGMTVNYRLTGEDAAKLPASEVNERAEAGAYPSVWELYKEDTKAQQEAANQDRALGFGGDGDRESGELERVFEGDDWDILVDGGCRGDIDDAFQVGAARSLGVPKSNVVVLDAKIGSLHVNYKVRGCPDDDDEIARKIEEEEFPELMDLYKRRIRGGDEGEDGAGKTRGAPAEDEVDEEQPEEVDEEQPEEGEKEAEHDEEQPEEVDEEQPEEAEKEAEHDEEQPEEVDEEQPEEAEKEAEQDEEQPEEVDEEQPEEEDQAQERAVAAVAPVPAAATSPHVTKLAVSFDGEDWDYVLERKSQAVAAAFKEETAAALSVTEKDVTITEFVLGSLLVQFKVHHDGAKTEDEMSRMIDAYPYEKVWALYEDRPSGATATRALNNAATLNRTSTTHEVGFEAPNWEYVERVRHEQILNAFATAAAKACGVEPGDVQGAETAVYPNMMKVTSTILHPVSMSADAVNQAMDAYSFEEVWVLYEDGDIGRETKPLTRSFDGDDWAGIVRSAKSAVTEAFRADTSNCLNVPRSAITVKEVRSGSLVVAYTARVPPELSEAEVERLTAEYAYPEVWALYKPREGSAPRSAAVAERADGSTAPSQRVFKGVNWDLVVEKQRAELKKAFAEDTAAALGTNESEVDLVSLYTTEGGLVMNYHAEKNGATKDEVEQAVHEAEYAKVWALYRLHADDGYVTTEHGVGFDGEDWDYVLEKNEQTLVDTFVMCTAELLGLQSRHVSNVAANVEPDNSGVALTFTVNHPRSITKSMVDKKLEECRYDPVWQLYETRPYDPSVLVVSAHEIRFEGEGWDFVLEKKRPQVESSFCEDVAEAMHLEPTAVQGVRIEKGETGIVVGCNVTHSPLQDEEMIQEELERHDFSRVWDLYEQRPHAARGDQAVTSHQVGFEGERWAEVMSHRRAKVLNALRVDTAAALQVTPEDVLEVTTEEQVDIMVCNITVQHPHDRTEDMVQEQLSQFDYDRVWALYDDTIAPRVDVLKNRGNSRLTAVMTKRFDGADWDVAVGEYPDRIREAFAIDTAEVLQCTPAQVVVDKVDVGSLIVDYRVRDLNITERAATELTDGYAYPNVWALYKPRGSDVLSARASTTGTRAPPAPIRDNVSARASVNARANQQESKAKRDAEAAMKAAEEAKRKEAEAAAAARQAQQELDAAEEEARRAEDEAQRALERARERRAAAAAAAQAAQAEEERRAQEALEEAQRAVEAAQKADEAAEDARKRNLVPLETGEAEDEQESLEYLRKALSQARRERDEYQDELEQIKARQRNLDGMQKEVAQMRSTTPTASRAPAKETKEDEYDEY